MPTSSRLFGFDHERPERHEVLERLAANPMTGGIPVLIITSKVLAEEEHQKPGARAVAVLSKSILAEEQTGAKIEEALLKAGVEKLKRI